MSHDNEHLNAINKRQPISLDHSWVVVQVATFYFYFYLCEMLYFLVVIFSFLSINFVTRIVNVAESCDLGGSREFLPSIYICLKVAFGVFRFQTTLAAWCKNLKKPMDGINMAIALLLTRTCRYSKSIFCGVSWDVKAYRQL